MLRTRSHLDHCATAISYVGDKSAIRDCELARTEAIRPREDGPAERCKRIAEGAIDEEGEPSLLGEESTDSDD